MAYVRDTEGLNAKMAAAGYPGSYFLFRPKAYSDAVLVRGNPGRLNGSRRLDGRVTRLSVPDLGSYVKDHFGFELARQGNQLFLVEETWTN